MKIKDRLKYDMTWCRVSRIPWWARLLWPTLHWCPEWDDLAIDKDDPEFECCECFKSKRLDRATYSTIME